MFEQHWHRTPPLFVLIVHRHLIHSHIHFHSFSLLLYKIGNNKALELRPLNAKASFSGRSKKIHKSTFSRDNRDVKWCKLVAQLIFL
jgi:hypothetical protein